MGRLAFTLGHTIFTASPELLPRTIAHEKGHVRQYEILGDAFLPACLGAQAYAAVYCARRAGDFADCLHDSNFFEKMAGDP